MGISSSLGSSALLPAGLGFRNLIINGAFDINQRGFTSQTAVGYNFDRWRLAPGGDGTSTVTPQTFTLGAAPVQGYESKNFVQIAVSGQTSASALTIYPQRIENVRTSANQQIAVSFWARATSGTPKVAIEFEQNFGTGGSPSTAVTTYMNNVTISTSWTRYVVTGLIPSISGKTIGTANDSFLSLNMWLSGGSTHNARTGSIGIQNSTFQIWGVQVEQNYQPTPFEQRPVGVELALCQRYYTKLQNITAPSYCGQGQARNGTAFCLFGAVPLPVTMRTDPAISINDMACEPNGGGGVTLVSSPATFSTTTNAGFYTTRTAGTWGADLSLILFFNSTASFIAAD
jgi:hypothetical protein